MRAPAPAPLNPARPAPLTSSSLPSTHSYAHDINLSSLDVLNHQRLLNSARADPSAVSFQVRG